MRGGQRASKKALEGGHAEHIHAHCNCEYAVRFDSRTTVVGYDPDKYLDQYYDHGGDLNAMRRAQYAKDKNRINAQKRAAYAVRKLRHASAGGILGENAGAYIPITEQSINAVQPFECITLDKAGQNALAEEHRQLLRVAMDWTVRHSGMLLLVKTAACESQTTIRPISRHIRIQAG